MIWGYAGVWSGDYEIWKLEDKLMGQLQFVVDHGFKSTGFPLKELRDPVRHDQVAAFVAEHDLQLTVHPYPRWFEHSEDELKRAGDEFIADLTAFKDVLRVPICITTPGKVHRFLDEPNLQQQLDHLSNVLAPIAKECHQLGCPLGMENHGDYYGSDLAELCRRVPHLGVFFDTGNTFLIGERPIPAAEAVAPYTIGTHFKDHLVQPCKSPLRFEIEGASLGAGHVGLAEIYAILKEHAPNPDKLVMQWELVPPKDMNGLDSLEESWQFIRSLETTV